MGHGSVVKLKFLVFTVMSIACLTGITADFDITDILSNYPDFSLLNQLLTSTKVAGEINNRTGLTLFAPSNDVLSEFQAGIPNANVAFMGDLLRHHVALQYFDLPALQAFKANISVATLLQQAGRGRANEDVLLISNMPLVGNGTIFINNTVETTLVSNLTLIANEISIIEIDHVLQPVTFPELAVSNDTEAPNNITATLESFGDFNLFASFLKQTGVDSIFEGRQATEAGITIFAPTDDAFNELPGQWFQNFSDTEQKLFMEYHALDKYYALGDLWELVHFPVETVATTLDKTGSYLLYINSTAGVVNVRAGKSNATITSTLYQAIPVIMYAIDTVLLPSELFSDSRRSIPRDNSSAEGPAPVPGPASALIGSLSPLARKDQSMEPTAPPPGVPGGRAAELRARFTLATLVVASLVLSSSLFHL